MRNSEVKCGKTQNNAVFDTRIPMRNAELKTSEVAERGRKIILVIFFEIQ